MMEPVEISTFETELHRLLPSAAMVVDAPQHPHGRWFLDVRHAGNHVVVEWGPTTGFGLSIVNEVSGPHRGATQLEATRMSNPPGCNCRYEHPSDPTCPALKTSSVEDDEPMPTHAEVATWPTALFKRKQVAAHPEEHGHWDVADIRKLLWERDLLRAALDTARQASYLTRLEEALVLIQRYVAWERWPPYLQEVVPKEEVDQADRYRWCGNPPAVEPLRYRMTDADIQRWERVALRRAIGQLVTQARRDAGLTQVGLAAKSGLSRATVANIETGNQNLRIATLYRLGAALGREPHTLVPAQAPRWVETDQTKEDAAFIEAFYRDNPKEAL